MEQYFGRQILVSMNIPKTKNMWISLDNQYNLLNIINTYFLCAVRCKWVKFRTCLVVLHSFKNCVATIERVSRKCYYFWGILLWPPEFFWKLNWNNGNFYNSFTSNTAPINFIIVLRHFVYVWSMKAVLINFAFGFFLEISKI